MKKFNFFKKIKKEKIFLPKESLEELSGIEVLKNIIAPSGLEINSNFLKLGNLYGKSFFVFSYPSYLDFGWLNEIINLERIFDIGIFFHPVDVSSALKQLRKKAAQIAAQIAELEEKGYVRDPELETAYQNIERLRDALQKAQEKLFRVGFYLTLWAENLEELEAAEKEISLLLEGKLIYLKPAVFLQWEGAESCFPLGLDKIKAHTILDTLPASTFFPFVSLTLSSDEGVLYGINLHNSTPVILDRFSLENANMLVFAQSGAGKSYFAKLETIRSLMRDIEVLIIDPEKEYKNLAFALDGDFFDISIASDYKINPFDLPKGSPDESNEEILKSNILTLVGLLKLMLKEIPPEKEPLLYQALEKVYELRDITPKTDFSKISQYPLLSDLEAVLEGMEGGKELAQRLYPYTKGVYAGFLNRPTTIKIRNRLVVFSLRDLEEELRPIAMYLILNFIWNSIRSHLKRRIVLIDEAWWMMRYPDSASYLSALVKRARKYLLGITTITQNISDFLNSPCGMPIITNSSLQFLLKNSPANSKLIAKTLGLSEVERRLLERFDVGEGLFLTSLGHVPIKVISSYTEHKLITTKPE